MKYHYAWLIWSSAFLLPWLALYVFDAKARGVLWRTSLVTALFGLTEPIFVPAYWNPPSLFELAQRSGFDLESLIFTFAIGGIGAALYNTVRGRHLVPIESAEKGLSRHRLHLAALLVPSVLFLPLYLLPWNPIYPSIVCLLAGAISALSCRPDLTGKTVVGGFLFFGLYALFMLGLKWGARGYIEQVWNLRALSGGLIYGIPTEELLFGFSFGAYWTGVYEHFTWKRSIAHADAR